MKPKNPTDTLKENIMYLQGKQAVELKLMKEQFHTTYESLKPINLIKGTFNEVVESPQIKSNIVNNAIGLTTGYLSKIVLFGASRNPLTKIMGTLLQFAVTNIAAKHSDTIKSAGEIIVHRILKFRKDSKKEFHNNSNDLSV